MSFVAVAIGGSALLGAAGGIAGGIIQGNATRDAAQTQADAANHAADLQHQMYEQQRDDQQPWRQAGATALSQMGSPDFQKNFSMSDFQADPGYQFRMQQGQKAMEASAAARGGLMSGNFAQALTNYGQDAASNEYQNAYNRFNNNQSQRFNRLASLAGMGQTANGQTAAAGENYANSVGNLMTGSANAQGASMIAGANAMSNGISNVGNTLSGLGKSWMQYSMSNQSPSIGMPALGSSSYGGASSSTGTLSGMNYGQSSSDFFGLG